MRMEKELVRELHSLTINDVSIVGGKNASLGEMIRTLKPKGVRVPGGFATTAWAFKYFMTSPCVGAKSKKTLGQWVTEILKTLDTNNLKELAHKGKQIRSAIARATMPEDLVIAILQAYRKMEKEYGRMCDVAVRSSATAEDLPDASFAGQQETFLNIRGERQVIKAVQKCFASLFTDRAISYRANKGFSATDIALSAGIQKMVRSDKGASGVMFTLDTESGFKDVVLINGAWGLGEMIVQGEVIPDEFLVYKPFLGKKEIIPIISKKIGAKDRKMIYATGSKPTTIVSVREKERNTFVLNDKEILTLAQWGTLIEDHYSTVRNKWTPMDIEWAKDGVDGNLYIVQARPETVQSQKDFSVIKEYQRKEDSQLLCKGASVGNAITSGKARVILDVKHIESFKKGEVLVTDMTDPDWEPIMKIAAAIVTDKGGRTSHAAIVSRELGIPCIVGSEVATKKIKTGDVITIDTTGGDGYVFRGKLHFSVKEQSIKNISKPPVKIMVNIGTPDTAFEKSMLPVDGVGLAREEFIIASDIGIHPMALVEYKKLKERAQKLKTKKERDEIRDIIKAIDQKTSGYSDKKQYYVDTLAAGIAKIGAAFFPREVIVRFSDFKTNEYRQLIGGTLYEPHEENPMLGWRGASRYYHPAFAPAFALEVQAIKKVREDMGLTNVHVLVPMCRTIEEGKRVIECVEQNGLTRGTAPEAHRLKIYVMCEIPSNILLADEFLSLFDGMSIGSNDLTQMTLGLDRDGNERIRGIANENNQAVKTLVAQIIKKCIARGKYIGICGQAPSDYPEFAQFLVDEHITSISLNPDAVIKTIVALTKKE